MRADATIALSRALQELQERFGYIVFCSMRTLQVGDVLESDDGLSPLRVTGPSSQAEEEEQFQFLLSLDSRVKRIPIPSGEVQFYRAIAE